MDVFRAKLNYPDLKAKMIQLATIYNPWVILIEDTGVGTGLIDELRIEGLNSVDIKATQPKEIRAQIQTAKFQSKRVLFPAEAPFLSDFIAELLAFPGGRNDDQVDSITQALAYEYLTMGSGVDYL